MAKHLFNSETARAAGKKGKRRDPIKKALGDMIDQLIEDKLTPESLWNDIEEIESPAQRFDRKIALLEFRIPKPKQIDVSIDSPDIGYIIGGLVPPKHEFNG